jgi:glycosyltransferase involved in cell wall biosynthesis
VNNNLNIAIVVPGGIEIDENIPSLIDLLYRLSEYYHLRIYSFSQRTPHPMLLSRQCSFVFPPKILEKNKFLTFLYFLWRIRTDHKKTKFSAVHGFWVFTQGLTAVIAGKILRIPSLVSLPGGDIVYLPSIQYGSMSHPVKKMMVRWCIHNADHVIVLTQYQKSLLDAHKISPRYLSVIPFGVDLSIFTFHPHTLDEPLQFISIGNLNKVKDPFTLVKTFFLLSRTFNCRLTIVGSDILNGTVQKCARDLGVDDKIQWKGKIPYGKIPAELHNSDFLLLTSRYEGEAVVVMEAFASGVVVVGTKVGLLADVGDESVSVSPGDAEGLVKKIERLLEHPQHLSEIRLQNRAYAEEHTGEWTCAKHRKLYDEVREWNECR